MKKLGFTLAEVLITLMILGIIASLTIPSLLQNTQNKEQVVQLKKGVSMINQAITMNYALTQYSLDHYTTNTSDLVAMLRERMNVTGSDTYYVRTQDGLTYYFDVATAACADGTPVDKDGAKVDANTCFDVVVSTAPGSPKANYAAAAEEVASSTKGVFTGFYQFYAGKNSVVPDANTATILNASDASKLTKEDLGS